MELEEKRSFTFMWKIENFSHCLQTRNESLESPKFVIESMDESIWRISIYPCDKNEFLSYCISDVSSENTEIIVNHELSVMGADGKVVNVEPTELIKSVTGSLSLSTNLSLKELYKTIRSNLVLPDMLTLTCRFWKTGGKNVSKNVGCFARTRIGVKKLSKVWSIDNFSKLLSEYPRSMTVLLNEVDKSPLILRVCLKVLFEKVPQFQIYLETCTTKSLLSRKILVLDCFGKPVKEMSDKHMFFPNEDRIWLFRELIPYAKLNSKKSDLLLEDTLFLRFEFTLSIGVEHESIECVHYGLPNIPNMNSANELWNAVTLPYDLPLTTADSENRNSLNHDMLSLYHEKTLSDFNLKAEDVTFPVHKSILCARSPVFKLMLTSDAQESTRNSLNVPNVDADTMAGMLLYIYTDVFNHTGLESISKLYYAAKKYGILSLKRRCSLALKSCLTASNVCAILKVADKHEDAELASTVQDFILNHDEEILKSAEWSELDKNDYQLAAKTMYQVYRKKLQLKLF